MDPHPILQARSRASRTKMLSPRLHRSSAGRLHAGAQLYKLRSTLDPTCNFGTAGLTRTVDIRSTSYTPTDALPNDVNYCWHVLAQSGSSVSGWSPTYEFIKKWYIQAVPLTPVNNYLYVKIPFLAGPWYLVQPIIKLRFARIIVSPA